MLGIFRQKKQKKRLDGWYFTLFHAFNALIYSYKPIDRMTLINQFLLMKVWSRNTMNIATKSNKLSYTGFKYDKKIWKGFKSPKSLTNHRIKNVHLKNVHLTRNVRWTKSNEKCSSNKNVHLTKNDHLTRNVWLKSQGASKPMNGLSYRSNGLRHLNDKKFWKGFKIIDQQASEKNSHLTKWAC